VNIALNLKFKKLDDLCDQIFDYFHLAYYDLETKIDNELNINILKNKFDTFSDKHFKSAIKDFQKEIQLFKNVTPIELLNIEKISYEILNNFEKLINNNLFDIKAIHQLKIKLKKNILKLKDF